MEQVFFSIARDIKQRLADTDTRAEVFEFYELQKLGYSICLLDFGEVPLDEGIEHSSVKIEEIVDSFENITVNVSSQGTDVETLDTAIAKGKLL